MEGESAGQDLNCTVASALWRVARLPSEFADRIERVGYGYEEPRLKIG